MNTRSHATLSNEYQMLLANLPEEYSDQQLIESLVRDSAWTKRGAKELHYLAKQYGVFMLRNALALAETLDIEDGEAGF